MSERTETSRGGVDTAAVIAASAFKVGDLVEVTHPIYAGRGKILAAQWLENIKPRPGDPPHFLAWVVFPEAEENWPGVVDIIDPQYGFEERGRSIRAAQDRKR